MSELIIRSGKHDGKKLKLPERETLAGRGEECPLRLTSPDVSKQHCLLRVAPEGIYVRDLDSRNGTWVNEERITAEVLLRPGDQLRLGPMQFQVPVHKPGPLQFSPAEPQRTDPSKLPLSDDDIAAWLAHDTGQIADSGDSTVTELPVRAPVPDTSVPVMDAFPVQRSFRTVAEEAADIIRRWHNRQAARGEQP